MDDGLVLTENPVVLLYLANSFPGAGLGGRDQTERYQLQQWLSFIGSELHKGVFIPLLDAASPEDAKAYAIGKAASRLAHVDRQLADKPCLLSNFSVADAYLTTVLNWAVALKLDLSPWRNVVDYHTRMVERPSIAKALIEERALHADELARRGGR